MILQRNVYKDDITNLISRDIDLHDEHWEDLVLVEYLPRRERVAVEVEGVDDHAGVAAGDGDEDEEEAAPPDGPHCLGPAGDRQVPLHLGLVDPVDRHAEEVAADDHGPDSVPLSHVRLKVEQLHPARLVVAVKHLVGAARVVVTLHTGLN